MNKSLLDRRILVVEDEMMILMMLEGMLEDLGCTSITAAPTVKKALGLIEAQNFDVAMLDLNLNGEKSYPVADKLSARGVPFLFSTGYADHGMIEGYADRPVLKKPFQSEDLAETLRGLLAP
ncbi:MAG: response regulator [Phycisphaerales bacterium]|nr:response regulator [Hyphomonadaceae bacterium]